jgi:hypothetical protein
MFDPVEDDSPICYALQLCCAPNATNEELVIYGGQARICKMQEERATIDRAISIDRGILQQNCVTFGLMALNKDNADQAHRDMRLATIMKRINTTQK